MRIYKNFKESNNVTLYNGDCRKLLKRLPSESVDLVVTSPPYCIGKAYEDPHDDIETFRKQHQGKIKNIRNFLASKGAAFYNNIIVALPDTVAFCDEAHQYKTIDEIGALEGNCQLVLPKEMNSICVIDGQHRIFAHYESGIPSKQERTIAELRKQLHLLVTGLIFPKDMPPEERARIQSEIFLDINSNAKLVPQNVPYRMIPPTRSITN